jgi:hypothetical protein
MVNRSFSSDLVLFCASLALTFTTLVDLNAQTATSLPDGPALGASIDRFVYEGEGITAVSFRFSGLHSRSVGSEVAVSLFPDALQSGAVYLASDLGPAFNISGPGITVLLKAGVSTLTGFGGGFAFTPGYHLGGGVILRAAGRLGIRVDLARHVYVSGVESTEPIWSVGVGFTSLARPGAALAKTPATPRTEGGKAINR